MPSNAPYGPNSNPTGAVPVREASSPNGATLVRFVQTNPFDRNGNGIVDEVDNAPESAALAASILALSARADTQNAMLAALSAQLSAVSLVASAAATRVNGVVPGTQLPTLAGLKHNLLALADPTANDKTIPGGWSVGSMWVNVVAGSVWQCVDGGLAGSAVWRCLTHHAATDITSGVLAPARLASGGSPLQVLRRKAGNTALEWATVNSSTGLALMGAGVTPTEYTDTVWVPHVTPSSVGGSAVNFSLPHTDMIAASLMVFRSGQLLAAGGADYTITGAAAFQLVRALGGAERLLAFYFRGTAAVSSNPNG